MDSNKGTTYSLTVRANEFRIPPVTDGLVVGKEAPIGFSALSKALDLLLADHFVTIEVQDDRVSHIIVRAGVLRRIPQDKFVAFVLERVKPLMCAKEVLHLDIAVEVTLEGANL